MRMHAFAPAMTFLAMLTPAVAQAQEDQSGSSSDVIIMRRVIQEKRVDPSAGGLNGGVVDPASGGLIGGVVELLTGPSYGWYNICASNSPTQLCVAFDEDGGLSVASDQTRCEIPQSLVHSNFVTSLSTQLLGSVTAIVKAGPKPALRSCENPPTRGYGYNCVYPGGLGCYSVDSQDGIIQPVEGSFCAAPQKAGLNIASMLKANAMFDVGQGVSNASCVVAESAYGRKDECAWTTGSNGDRVMALKQSCFGFTKDNVTTPAPMSTCASAPPTTASQQTLLRLVGLVPSDRDPVSCGNRDTAANLVSRIVSDKPGRDADGYATRTVSFSFKCMKAGIALLDKKPCAQQIASWERESSRNANDDLKAYESTIDLVAGVRTEIWTDYAGGTG